MTRIQMAIGEIREVVSELIVKAPMTEMQATNKLFDRASDAVKVIEEEVEKLIEQHKKA